MVLKTFSTTNPCIKTRLTQTPRPAPAHNMSNTICSKSQHNDRLKLGKNIVIHPFVSLQPLVGPIVIEDGVIIEEKTLITNNKSSPLVIGSHSHIQVGSTVVDSNIGRNCILQPRCKYHY